MARRCQISGTSRQCGNRVSHAKNRTKHLFQPNLQVKRVYIPEEKRYVTLKISTRVIRTIDKFGLQATLKKYGMSLSDLA
jgi:large subunit ribosomal protein L28